MAKKINQGDIVVINLPNAHSLKGKKIHANLAEVTRVVLNKFLYEVNTVGGQYYIWHNALIKA